MEPSAGFLHTEYTGMYKHYDNDLKFNETHTIFNSEIFILLALNLITTIFFVEGLDCTRNKMSYLYEFTTELKLDARNFDICLLARVLKRFNPFIFYCWFIIFHIDIH